MKVLDIILEQAGDPLDMLTSTANISATSGTEIQIRRIQELLSQHAKDGQAFWTKPANGKWDAELDSAIIAWKEWINEQLGRRVLNTGASNINQQALQYLRAKLTNQGRLDIPGLRTDPARTTNPFEGQTFKFEIENPNPVWTNDRTQNMRTMVSSIGLSGWIAVLHAARSDELQRVSQQAARRLSRAVITGINSRFDSPPAWKNNLENLLRTVRNENKSIEINGREYFLAYPHSAAGQDAPQKIFEYYKVLATHLLQGDLQRNIEFDRDQQETLDERGTLLSDVEIATIAANIHEAFEFSLFKGNTDEDALENIFSAMNRAGDYDKIEEKFNQLYSQEDPLSEQLASELDDNEYETIVVRNLIRIGRISPGSLFQAIKFGQNTSVDVTYENVTYNVPNEIDGFQIDIMTSTGKFVKDVILQDAILKQAIDDTGGTRPSDITINMSDQHGNRSRATFEQMLQDQVPEMVAFYTRARPFDEAPPLGIARAKAIMNELYRLSFAGAEQTRMDDYAKSEILKDRQFLLDDVLVYFDPKYRDESQVDDGFKVTEDVDDTLDEDIETNDEHEETATKFTSEEQDRIDEATREILNANDPADYFNKVRVAALRLGFTNRRRESIDLIHDPDADALKAVIEGNQPSEDAENMHRLITADIPLHIVARNQAAIVLDDAMGGNWDSTDEDSMYKIWNLVPDKASFEIIARAYRRLFAQDLIERIRREDSGVYTAIFRKYDLESPINMSGVETPFGEFKFMEPSGLGKFQVTIPQNHPLIGTILYGGLYGMNRELPENQDVVCYLTWDRTIGWYLNIYADTRGNPNRSNSIDDRASDQEIAAFITEFKSFVDALGYDADEYWENGPAAE